MRNRINPRTSNHNNITRFNTKLAKRNEKVDILFSDDKTKLIYKKHLMKIPYYKTFLSTKVGGDKGISEIPIPHDSFMRILDYVCKSIINILEEDIEYLAFLLVITNIHEDNGELRNIEDIRRDLLQDVIYKDSILLNNQKDHILNIINKFDNRGYVLDSSPMGEGKTYTACATAKYMNKFMFIICPKSTKENWKRVAYLFDVYDFIIETPGCISSKRKSIYTTYYEESKDNFVYKTSIHIDRFIKDGCIFIIDEVHNFKNKSYQADALSAITRRIYELRMQNRCKVLSLSATPYGIDNPYSGAFAKSVTNVSKVIGMMGYNKEWIKYNRKNKTYKPTGLKVYERTENIKVQFDISDNMSARIDRISTSIMSMRDNFTVCMSGNTNYTVRRIFLNLQDEEREELDQTYQEIQEAFELRAIVTFVKLLHIVQRSKTEPIIRKCAADLARNRKCKIVVFLPHLASIDIFCEDMESRGFRTLKLVGAMSVEARKHNMNLFNKPNLDYRVLATNTKVSSTGIDLDDKDGNYPRVVYIVPEYNFVNMFQSIGRFTRIDSKSEPMIHFVYLRGLSNEHHMLENINNKNRVLSEYINSTLDIVDN